MKRILLIAIIAIVCIAGYAQVPDITLYDINGKTVNIKTLCSEGAPVVISFFATWCKPCLRELKTISEVYDDWQEETGVRLVAVSIDQAQDVEKVKPLVNGNGWDYIVLLDPEGELKRKLQVQTIPHVFVVDRKGHIVEQHSGYTDGEEKKIFDRIKGL